MPLSPYARLGQTTITGTKVSARIHVVMGNESLSAIAAVEYSTGYSAELWRQIAEENDIDDLDAVTAGTALRIPPAQASTT